MGIKKGIPSFTLIAAVSFFIVSSLGLFSRLTADTFAQSDMYIYPKKGQSTEQLEKDKYECYIWAKKQSGFDPLETPKATTAPPAEQATEGGVVKGAARGAIVGTVTGAIAGDAGKGAAIGAASGGLFGGMRRRDQAIQSETAKQQWAQQQASQYANKRGEYDRAVSACLEARDYTVK